MSIEIKNKKLRSVVLFIVTAFVFVFMVVGRVIYYLSKLVRALAFFLMCNKNSAKEELVDFWSVFCNIKDV